MQSYFYGDGNNSNFRFCIDEYTGTAWGDHEVSKWTTVDWHGWKLVEWKLNDPDEVGIWIGDGNLTGQYFRIDSYQLTKTLESQISGVIYFDDLRAVKKVFGASGTDDEHSTTPASYFLSQNYPNPFNPATVINYQLPSAGNVIINVYDLLGNKIAILLDEYKQAGRYKVEFNAEALSSGVYFYQMLTDNYIDTKKMILVK